ncbi:MAG: chromosomal replication initiator protein DnaA [Candidatus Dojkabacteria bacterium]|jgi:chromosomal replication initiator protein|nr:chromosomal replication initiator protein DnaA [Candidatus Dojkabacteria bacterium]
MDKIDFENYIDGVAKPKVEGSGHSYQDIDTDDVWKIVSENLRMVLDRVEYKSWFGDTYLEDINNGVATFSCSSEFKKGTIQRDFKNLLQRCLLKATGQNLQIEFLLKSLPVQEKSKNRYEFVKPTSENIDLFSSSENEHKKYEKAIQSARLNPKYTFESFIVGSGNRLADAVAQAVVQDLGKAHNPVFFYGSTGVGKTHLMQAIGNEVIKKDPEKKVAYVSIEQFLNEMIESIRTKRNEDFRTKYREVDLLIIDDVQFVETYPKTQEELFHTFNSLYQSNKQIVLASDRPPKEIKNIADRLRSRFEGGMVADMQIPEYETRVAILKQILSEKKIVVADEYIELIAKNIESSVRELEGALNKVVTLMKLGEKPTYEEVARILQVDIESKRLRITPQRVIKSVSTIFDVPISDIKGSRRTAYVALTRQVVMYLLRKELDLPLERVAKEVNRKDHTTVIHAYKQISEKMEKDSRLAEKIESCKRELTQ